ncbi:MAG: hypothetical protein C0597_09400 [Marinilabiliales bacterium]|nr:MAG: hypothetical protein C0597_09400 [Marinilabiliales bacterium]
MKAVKLFLYTGLFFIFSCTNSSKEGYSLGEMESMEYDAEIAPVTRPTMAGTDFKTSHSDVNYIDNKKIIRDARIGVSVENYEVYRVRLDTAIYKLKGYVSNDNLEKTDYNIHCNISIRIPAENFDNFLGFLERGTVKLLYKNVTARDVTEEFIDVESRIKTKKEVEKRYVQLLSKAITIKEILEIEEKLRILREEIESREGRLKYLKNQVAFSTVYLEINQELDYKYEPIKEKSFLQRLWKSIHGGWKGFVTFLLFLVRIWPVILIGLAIFYYIRRIRRNKIKNKHSN